MRKLLEMVFMSKAQTRVVQHFLDRPKEFFNLSRIAKETGLAHSTIHRVVQPLVDIGLIKEIKVGRQIRLFILESEDPKSKILMEFYDRIKPHLEELL
ncbi:MAG: helix-turn-helix domain-containing protein [Candidatus Thorarchaeota archaeon]|nr:helix-turn-helix domain-containing protein [Candidatus Thorarchaeota archaeon]